MIDEDLAKLRIAEEDRAPVARRRHRWPWLAALLLLAAGAGALLLPGLRPAAEVRLATVTRLYPTQTFTLLTASGYVVAQRKAAVGAKITSRLEELAVEEGSRVTANQVVARLEAADLRAARDRARANVDVARAGVAQAEAELRDAELAWARARELLARRVGPQSDADAAEARHGIARAALAAARARVRAAEASLQEAQVQLDYTLIRAPFDAVVLTKNADVGDIITPLGAAANARASVITIADLGSNQVEVDVAEASIAQVRPGQACEIELDALPEARLRGRVHAVVPTADRSKASVLVKVAFAERDPRVLPEMSAKVAFLQHTPSDAERRPVTVVPRAALLERDGRRLAFGLREGRAVEVAVETGRTLDEAVEVLGGLAPGERVVLNPGEHLADGARVEVIE